MTSAVALTCRRATVEDLLRRAKAMPDAHGAGALRVACEAAEPLDGGDGGGRRLRLEQAALEFVEEQAPDLATRWPSVFESVERVEPGPTLGMIVALTYGLSKGTVDLELDVDPNGNTAKAAVRLAGGDRLIFTPDGGHLRVEWENPPPRPSEAAMALSERRTFRPGAEADYCACGLPRDEHNGSAAWCP